jgi:hypothetical protein
MAKLLILLASSKKLWRNPTTFMSHMPNHMAAGIGQLLHLVFIEI